MLVAARRRPRPRGRGRGARLLLQRRPAVRLDGADRPSPTRSTTSSSSHFLRADPGDDAAARPRVGRRHGLADLARPSWTPSPATSRTPTPRARPFWPAARPVPTLGPLFYEPTVLEGVTPEMICRDEETFGPVVSVYRVGSDDEAVALRQRHGVRAQRQRLDPRHPRAAARSPRRIRCGTVNINEGYAAAWASIGAPMGGMKESGLSAGGTAPRASEVHRGAERHGAARRSGLGRRSGCRKRRGPRAHAVADSAKRARTAVSWRRA